MWTIVKTQAELDAALEARATHISLEATIAVDVKIADTWYRPALKGILDSIFRLWGSSHVEAWGSSHVVAWGSSHVVAWESSHVEAWGSSHVVAWGSSHVVAWGSSHVVAWGSSHVVARGSSHVVARESSHVEAWGSSHVVAWGSSHVEARESSHVEAWGAVSLRLFGVSIKARATVQVAVQLHDRARCDGGAQVVITKPQTIAEWCEWYGCEVIGDHVVLFKGVNDDYRSPRGATYTPGTETIAPDWDGPARECGGGLHFSPAVPMTLEFHSDATKFIACRVALADLVLHPDGQYPQKVKARACWNWYECDRSGNQIGERFEPAKAIEVKPTAKKKPKAKAKPKATAKRKATTGRGR